MQTHKTLFTIFAIALLFPLLATTALAFEFDQPIWTGQTHFDGVTDIAIDDEGNLYTTSIDSSVMKVPASETISGTTGMFEEEWAYTGHSSRTNAVASDPDGNIFVGSNDNTVRRINEDHENPPGPSGADWLFEGHDANVNTVAYDPEGFVYSADQDGKLFKVNATSGVAVWNKTDIFSTAFSVFVDNNSDVYVAGEGQVYKFDSSGTEIWNRDEGFTPAFTSVVADDDGHAYVARGFSDSGSGLAVEKMSVNGQSIEWTYTYTTGATGTQASLAIDEQGNIYVTKNNGEVTKLNENGEEVWTFTGHTAASTGVVVQDGFVYSSSLDDTVQKYSVNPTIDLPNVGLFAGTTHPTINLSEYVSEYNSSETSLELFTEGFGQSIATVNTGESHAQDEFNLTLSEESGDSLINIEALQYVEGNDTFEVNITFSNDENHTDSFTLTILEPTPTVVYGDTTNVTNESAEFSAEVTSEGGANVTERGFVFGTSPNPDLNDTVIAVGSGIGSFEATAENLSSSTEYFVRAYATNSEGTSYSLEDSFTTSLTPILPELADISVDGVYDNKTVLNLTLFSEIISEGSSNVSEHGFLWSNESFPNTNNESVTFMGGGLVEFNHTIQLEAGQTYYLLAYATNEEGTGYSEEAPITVEEEQPPAETPVGLVALLTALIGVFAVVIVLGVVLNMVQEQTTVHNNIMRKIVMITFLLILTGIVMMQFGHFLI